jgi:hypothetical protein
MEVIRTVRELVDFLGGDTALSRVLGIDQSTVAQWKIRNDIPGGWHLRLIAEIHARGGSIDVSAVFGLSEEEAKHLFRPPLLSEARLAATA